MVWDVDNAVALCAGCHYRWHAQVIRGHANAIALVGESAVDALLMRKRMTKRVPGYGSMMFLAHVQELRRISPLVYEDLIRVWNKRLASKINKGLASAV
jgi:hypothetical protein